MECQKNQGWFFFLLVSGTSWAIKSFLPLYVCFISLSLSIQQIAYISLNIRQKILRIMGITRFVCGKLTNWNFWTVFVHSLGERDYDLASLRCTNTGLSSVAGAEKRMVVNSLGGCGRSWGGVFVCACVLWSKNSPQSRDIWAHLFQDDSYYT